MCSIGGWVTRDPLDEVTARRLTSALLYYGQDRGRQSGGIFVNGRVVKAACEPIELTARPEYSKAFEGGARIALTHTRMPTSGGRGDAQAQPFERPSTVTCHNGMYRNCPELMHEFGLTKSAGVDSELAADFVEQHGVKRLPDFLRTTRGTSALAIYRREPAMKDGRVYLIRDGNPLEVLSLTLPGGNCITAWASTGQMLLSALRYCWLVPYMTTMTLTDRQLYVARPKGVKGTGVKVTWPSTTHTVRHIQRDTSPVHGRGVSNWQPRGRKEELTPDEREERNELLRLLGWKDYAGMVTLKTLRRNVRKKFGAVTAEKANQKRSALLESYFRAMRENRKPTDDERRIYEEWHEELRDSRDDGLSGMGYD